jgi:hypothetical protein
MSDKIIKGAAMKFTIDRDIWIRGVTPESALLHSPTGKMCCVGIYLQACGVPRDRLKDKPTASWIDMDLLPANARWLVTGVGGDHETPAAAALYAVNDDFAVNELQREVEIVELFARQGIEVEFTN